jgi:hypothetical protein
MAAVEVLSLFRLFGANWRADLGMGKGDGRAPMRLQGCPIGSTILSIALVEADIVPDTVSLSPVGLTPSLIAV